MSEVERGKWRRRDSLPMASHQYRYAIATAIEHLWPAGCLTKQKVRSPRADVTMDEWYAWIETVCQQAGYAGSGRAAHQFVMWALTQPREAIEARVGMEALR